MLFILIHILLSFSGLNLLSMNTTMLLWQQLFVVGISPAKKEVCKGVAMSLHYLILSTFFWTHIMAWDLYQTFGQKAIFSQIRSRKYFKSYALYAWGTPLGNKTVLFFELCFLFFSILFLFLYLLFGVHQSFCLVLDLIYYF